ncbi:MAG: hypothetical protein R2785_01005 [Flavobacteriaceae bacterium]
MKKIVFFFLVSTSLTRVFSQDISSQHSIFGIENHHLTKDFNIKRAGSIYPVEVYQYTTFSFYDLQSVEVIKLSFNSSGFLVSKTFETNDKFAVDKYKKTTYLYEDSKLVKVNNTNKDNKPSVYFPEIIYNYDSNGRLIKVLYTIRFLDQKTDVYTYDSSNNSAKRYRYDGSEEEYKFDANGLIIQREITKIDGRVNQTNYSYNDGLMNSFTSVLDISKNNTSAQPTTYGYNEKNDVVKKSSGYLSDSFFSYVYDDYNNWVARFNAEEKDLEKNIVIRQITYSNGKVTGFRSTTDEKLLDAIKKQKQETTKVSNADIPTNGIFWKKNEDGSIFNVYLNGIKLKGEKGSIRNYLLANDVLVFDTNAKRLYRLKNYKFEKSDTFHKALEETLSDNLGYWVKTSDGGALVFDLNGNEINFNEDFISNDFIDGDLVSTKANGEKWIFKNSKNVPENKVFPIIKLDTSSQNNISSDTSTSNKPYEEESDYTWKKNEAGAYWFYKNYEAINNSKSFWNGNDLLVLDPNNNNLINLKGYKQGEPNITYKGFKINVDITDGFWYKLEGNQFHAYDNKGNQVADLEINKWSENKKDLIIKSKNSSQTYVLIDYAIAETYQVNPLKLEGYEKSTSNVYDKAAEALKAQTESVIKMAESMDEVYKKVAGECFKGNCNDGYGEKKWSSGNVAEAFFENGKPNGPGLINYKDGNHKFASFNGSWDNVEGFEFIDFKNNKAAQFINYKTKMGIYYDQKNNEFWELQIDAKSKTLLEPNNDKYCLVGNCQNGTGLYKYNNDVTYFGTFRNGRRHGFGDLRFPNGQYYIGEFNNDLKEGVGFYVWSDDKHYSGQWKNDTYHGKGIMSYSKTNYQAGLWENGKYIRSLDSKN